MNNLKKRIFLPVRCLIRDLGEQRLPGFKGFSLAEVFSVIGSHFQFQGLTEKAAAISYNLIMAIPPISLFIFTLIPNLPFVSREGMKSELNNLIASIIPSPTYNNGLIHFVDGFIDSSRIGLLSIYLIIILLIASNAVMGIIRAFQQTELSEGLKKQKGLRQRWEAIKLTVILFGLLLTTFLLLFTQSNILDWIGIHDSLIRLLILIGKWVLIVSLIFFSYSFIFRYATSTAKRWRFISPGAIVSTILTMIVSIGFVTFVTNFGKYNFLYGAIGTAMVVMAMIFLNALVLFFGFLINLSIHLLLIDQERSYDAAEEIVESL